MTSNWHFRPKSPMELHQAPRHGELFDSNEELDQRDLLVREALQNALDASSGDSPVTVTFRLGTLPNPNADPRIVRVLEEPRRRMNAAQGAASNDLSLDKPMRYLVVEDFQTTGLTGDVARWKLDAGEAGEHRFFYFWRNIGRSGKGGASDSALGSWGLGKAVFYKASAAGTYFGLSRRADDETTVLMGLALVGAHELDGNSWDWYGYWGSHSGSQADPVLPVDDVDPIMDVHDAFGLSRDLTEQNGLSVIVPWLEDSGWQTDKLKPDWTAKKLARAAIEQFYLPILSGDLILRFQDENHNLTVTLDSIDESARETGAFGSAEQASSMLGLARTWLTPGKTPVVVLPESPDAVTPSWDQWQGDTALDRIRELWAKHNRIIVHVPVPLKSKLHGVQQGRFSIVLERDDSLLRGVAEYFRGGMKVPGTRAWNFHRARALVLVPRVDPVATLLGHAENPAHTRWGMEKAFKDAAYRGGLDNIKFVVQSPRRLHALLDAAGDEKDHLALADLFPRFVVEDTDVESGRPRRRRRKEVKPVGPLPPPTPQTWRIDDSAVGFRVSCTDAAPDALRVQVGYAGADAFKPPLNAEVADFNLAAAAEWGIKIRLDNASLEDVSFGELRLARETPGPFGINVEGFDENRDLAVRVTKAKDPA